MLFPPILAFNTCKDEGGTLICLEISFLLLTQTWQLIKTRQHPNNPLIFQYRERWFLKSYFKLLWCFYAYFDSCKMYWPITTTKMPLSRKLLLLLNTILSFSIGITSSLWWGQEVGAPTTRWVSLKLFKSLPILMESRPRELLNKESRHWIFWLQIPVTNKELICISESSFSTYLISHYTF